MKPDANTAWNAVAHRDPKFDGRFVYAVSSTKIFCRPSCSSRRPNKSNVEFFGTTTEAEMAGYRACKRCRPTSVKPPVIDRAVKAALEYLLNHMDTPVTLAMLARETGMSPFHLQRSFKRALGVSPRQYQTAERRRRLSQRLRKGDTVSRATYEAGYGSSSRVYERKQLGMTPATVRKGGVGQRIQFSIVDSPLGRLLGAYTENGVCAVRLGDDDRALEKELRDEFPEAEINRAGSTAHEWVVAIVKSIDSGKPSAAIPVDAQGTAFQHKVWNALQQIPRGTTVTYSQVAERIGQPSAVRAVARAIATNPVALVVPCHRVVGKDGELTGYRWGVERKAKILEIEKA